MSRQVHSYVPLPPEEIRIRGNHLIGERSAYLRQHAHNPLDWYPWGAEALGRAREENKPIFLSIGYSSCHWCHVMESEVFEHDDVAVFMNEHFVSIKVDREERPDLDAVYMNAVVAMAGHGGWPMSVFLTPSLRPFFGGTYFPRDQFLTLAKGIHQKYRADRQGIDSWADTVLERVSVSPEISPASPIDTELPEAAARQALAHFDHEWGGLRSRQKFPTPVYWQFLLHHYRKTGDRRYGRMVELTLDRMGSGGIHDHVGGGFHRYTVEETWLVPHFEKMLYDNAQIAALYAEASTVFGSGRYAEIARDTLDFIIRDMSGEEGGFYSSFDADSGGEEGSFYLWSLEEITEVAGPTDGPPLAMLLDVAEKGNFEGKSILSRRVDPANVASHLGRSEAEVALLVEKHRDALRSFRETRVKPNLDKKIVTSWNGLTIAALAAGHSLFKREEYLRAAQRAADYLWSTHRRPDGGLYRSSNQRKAENEGILDDYAFLALGFLELYQASAEPEHLERGLLLIDHARDHFKHAQAGFYLTSKGQPVPLGRHLEIHDSVRPSGNSAMLQALIRAAALTGNTVYREEVEIALRAYAGEMRAAGLDMAWWLDGTEKYLGPYYEVVIVGDPSHARWAELIYAFRSLNPSHAVLMVLPASEDEEPLVRLLPSTKGKRALHGQPTAYVCQFGACKLPTSDPAQMRKQILEGWTG